MNGQMERVERIPALPKQPEVRRRRGGKLLWILSALFAIVLVFLFFRSSLSRISTIEVTGVSHLKESEVKAALKVVPGDSFFAPSAAQLMKRVETLEPVKTVKVVKKFPGELRVSIEEYPEVAAELNPDGSANVVLANGLALPAAAGIMPDRPILSGWKDNPNRKALCEVLGTLDQGMLSDLSEIVPDPSKAYPDRIKLYTRSRFDVVTTVGMLADKIPYLNDIVQNREPGTVVMLDADTYLPYSAQSAQQTASDAGKVKEKASTQ
jgi:cell division protein FtsQ